MMNYLSKHTVASSLIFGTVTTLILSAIVGLSDPKFMSDLSNGEVLNWLPLVGPLFIVIYLVIAIPVALVLSFVIFFPILKLLKNDNSSNLPQAQKDTNSPLRIALIIAIGGLLIVFSYFIFSGNPSSNDVRSIQPISQ